MKIKVEKHSAIAALKVASSCVFSRNIMPILNNVLVEAEGETVKLTCSNLEQRISTTVKAEVEEPGKATIPARRLLSVLDAMRNGEITFTTDEAGHTTVKAGKSTVKLLGLPAEDYPCDTEVEAGFSYTIKAKDLRDMLGRGAYAVSADASRRALTGAFFSFDKESFDIVSTDGKRLAICGINEQTEKEYHGIVPPGAIAFLKSLPDGDVVLKFTADGKKMIAAMENITFESKMIEGNFPNFKQVVPKDTKLSVNIPAKDFWEKMAVVSLVSHDNIELTFKDNSLILHAESAEDGTADDEMPVPYDKDPVTFMFQPGFLVDAVKANPVNDTFAFKFNDSNNPTILQFGENSMTVIMPMRKKAPEAVKRQIGQAGEVQKNDR